MSWAPGSVETSLGKKVSTNIKLVVLSFILVNLWLPIEEAWEIKYHASNIFHGDYFGFKIQGRQIPCPTSTSSPTTIRTAATLSTTEVDAVVVENCELTGTCDEGEGRTIPLETTTPAFEEEENIPTPSKRIVG